MGFISEALRLLRDQRSDKENRQRGEDHLRQLEIEELERRRAARSRPNGETHG